ncbi:Lipid A 3-O-deacylase (PagL) [Pseudoxanthomonas sp. CF385]|uniref:acyloxyacyl hydrolase n=1 Tax=Pseudoxanthomonas sp. CF385 TaxID=1881042 RepID=UPI00087EEA8F|nr:acyloxyacyl hydrolase [Pseudoxanthomonas sp. CF385]SDR02206.1 Lipid A 3-O-deacylase (PagL) [Pseudoxanthomonas sp. CF385]
MSVPHRNAANLVSIPSLFSPRALPRLALGLLLAVSATHAFAAEPRNAWYVQGGVAEDAQSLTVGMSRDWRWEKQYRYGHISGQWQGEVARWHSDSQNSTQLGVTPAVRWRPNGWDDGWFVEGGIGLNVIFPKYDTRKKAFSTTFNFGDHIAIGKRFGADDQHEWSLRFQHFSNARIKKPNPGENFLQFRYTQRF